MQGWEYITGKDHSCDCPRIFGPAAVLGSREIVQARPISLDIRRVVEREQDSLDAEVLDKVIDDLNLRRSIASHLLKGSEALSPDRGGSGATLGRARVLANAPPLQRRAPPHVVVVGGFLVRGGDDGCAVDTQHHSGRLQQGI